MRRREFIILLGGAMVTRPLGAHAHRPSVCGGSVYSCRSEEKIRKCRAAFCCSERPALEQLGCEAVPMNSKAQITAVAAGDAWLEKGANLLLFRPPGGGKSHLASAIGLAFIGATDDCFDA